MNWSTKGIIVVICLSVIGFVASVWFFVQKEHNNSQNVQEIKPQIELIRNNNKPLPKISDKDLQRVKETLQ